MNLDKNNLDDTREFKNSDILDILNDENSEINISNEEKDDLEITKIFNFDELNKYWL